MGWTGFYTCVLHFASFTCLLVSGSACAMYTVTINNQHPELKYPPYPPDLYQGHLFGAAFGIIGGIWAFFTFIPCIILIRISDRQKSNATARWMFISFMTDLVITAGLIISIRAQASYLPSPLGTCDGIDDLKPYPTGEPHWIEVLIKGKKTDKYATCKMEVMIWRIEIAMAIICGICVLLAGSFIFRTPGWCGPFPGSPWCGKWIRYLNHRRHKMKDTKVYIASLNNSKEETTIARVGEKSSSSGNSTTRGEEIPAHTREFDIELALQRPLSNNMATAGHTTASSIRTSIASYTTAPQRSLVCLKNEEYLMRILGSYELAKIIALNCHFTDFRSLALVSKNLRMAALGSMGLQILKQTTCLPSRHPLPTKSTCWTCGNQICLDCKITRSISSESTFHIENCSPYCGDCFRKWFCSKPTYEDKEVPRKHWTPLKCLGHGSRRLTEVPSVAGVKDGKKLVWAEAAMKGEYGRKIPRRFKRWYGFQDMRSVCTLCAETWWGITPTHTGEARRSTSAAFTSIEAGTGSGCGRDRLLAIERHGLINSIGAKKSKECTGCKKDLKPENGELVWWACAICGCECTEDFHREVWVDGKRVDDCL